MGIVEWTAIGAFVALIVLAVVVMGRQNRPYDGRPRVARKDGGALFRDARAAADATRSHLANGGGNGM